MTETTIPSKEEILARLDRLPVWPYSYWLLLIIGIGFFFSFFDIVTIGIALPVFTKQFHVTTAAATWTITSGLIGYIIGSLLDSRLSDLCGRKVALILSVFFFSGGSILSATSSDLTQLIIWRFIIGMGIGAEIANVVTYIGELSPADQRGRYSAMCVTFAFFGFAFVPFIGLALVPQFPWGWRLMFVLGGLGGVVVLFMRLFTPESIRWLVSHKKMQEAHTQLLELERECRHRIRAELPEPVVQSSHRQQHSNHKFSSVLHSSVVGYVVLFALVWAFYYIGNYAWLTLDTKLFILAGFQLKNSLLLVSLSSMGFVFGSLFSIWASDRFERKWFCFIVSLLWAGILLIIGWWTSFGVILFFGFLAAFSIGAIIPVMYTFTAEHFPTPVRATCMSITDGVGHIGGAFCGQIIFAFYYWYQASGRGVSVAFTAMSITGVFTALLLLFAQKKNRKALNQ
ncbi:MAG: MFS transporter [Coxiellaceae bacterium]|nr:MFS transporter [Coxiellaceae bacterium]